MSQYRHILVGLDLSEDSENVLTKARGLASANQAKLSVVHVIEPLAFAYGGDAPVDLSEAQNLMEDQAKKRLAAISDDFDVAPDARYVRLGQTANELHALAEEKKADLIVVGSHGRHGLALLFGNTANGVIKGAQCDVLAVRV